MALLLDRYREERRRINPPWYALLVAIARSCIRKTPEHVLDLAMIATEQRLLIQNITEVPRDAIFIAWDELRQVLINGSVVGAETYRRWRYVPSCRNSVLWSEPHPFSDFGEDAQVLTEWSS